LQNNKATGLDSIGNESLKAGGACLVSALSEIFNFIWAQAVMPSVWHHSTICLIFKENGADPLDAKSYRPISLTSCVEKASERVMLNRLTEHFEKDNLITEEQAGFHPGRETKDQTYILREITDARTSKKLKSILTFVDLTNAFPSVWHDVMWYCLLQSGVRGKIYRSI
jgi:hypothetical protein